MALLSRRERTLAFFEAMAGRGVCALMSVRRWPQMVGILGGEGWDVAVFDCPRACPVGFHHCGLLAAQAGVPFVVIGRDGGAAARRAAWRSGAAAFVADPFQPHALLRALGAVASGGRAVRPRDEWVWLAPALALDLAGRELWDRGLRVPLNGREFRLLRCLLARRGEVVAADELVESAWPEADGERGRRRGDLYVYIRSLRRKLGDDPAEPRLLVNHYGKGYVLMECPLGAASDPRWSPESICGAVPAPGEREAGAGAGAVLRQHAP